MLLRELDLLDVHFKFDFSILTLRYPFALAINVVPHLVGAIYFVLTYRSSTLSVNEIRWRKRAPYFFLLCDVLTIGSIVRLVSSS